MEINSINDVKGISKKNANNVMFKLKELSAEDNIEWEKRFNGLLCECGCSSGRNYLKLFTPFLIVIGILVLVFSSIPYAIIISAFIIANIIAGVIGKIKGLRRRDENIKILINEFNGKYSFISN